MSKSDKYPIGAIVIHGGILDENSNWLLCDGREFETSDYPELFNAINYLYGGHSENKIFKIPDFQGVFLRGSSRESDVDPDKLNRKILHPERANASQGVGTFQPYRTKSPGPGNFKTSFNHLPVKLLTSTLSSKDKRTGYTEDKPTIEQDTCTSGGDKETRPINVYVNFYIKAH